LSSLTLQELIDDSYFVLVIIIYTVFGIKGSESYRDESPGQVPPLMKSYTKLKTLNRFNLSVVRAMRVRFGGANVKMAHQGLNRRGQGKRQGASDKFEKILDSSLLIRISYCPAISSYTGRTGKEGSIVNR